MDHTAMPGMPHDHGSASGSTAGANAGDDKGLSLLENGDMAHHYGPDQPLDAATRRRLARQLALTQLVAARFPTLRDAEAAGSRAAGGFDPGLGIHMGMPAVAIDIPASMAGPAPVKGELSDEQLVHPSNLLYDGTTPDARLAGFMYVAMGAGEPVGFAGPNDHWHTHGKLCLRMGGADGIKTIQNPKGTAEACKALGGFFVERTTYMVHVWTVPGYESNRGVFSDVNPALSCSDGTYFTIPQRDRDKYQRNHCRADAQ